MMYPFEENEDEVELQSALPKTKGKVAGGMLTNAVSPDTDERAKSYRLLGRSLVNAGLETMSAQPDVKGIEQYGAQRQEDARTSMLAALAAQYAGEDFSQIQGALLKQAMSKYEPVKYGEAGTLDGAQFVGNPFYRQSQTANTQLTQGRQYLDMADDLETSIARQEAAAARAQSAAVERGYRNEERGWRGEDRLRSDYEKETEPYQDELKATAKVLETVAAYGTNYSAMPAVAQQSLVILLNKFLDPGSVVREGEFDRVIKAQGVEGQLMNAWERITKGKPLDANTIVQIRDLALQYQQFAQARIAGIGNNYSELAGRRGLDPSAVVFTPRTAPNASGKKTVSWADLSQ